MKTSEFHLSQQQYYTSNYRFHSYLLDLMLEEGKFVTVDTVKCLETL